MPSLGAEATPRRGLLRWLMGLFDPIVVKELRATMRSNRTSYGMWVILLITALGLVAALVAHGGHDNPARLGSDLFHVFLFVHLAAIVLILPAYACTSLTEERSRQSFDLLVTTGLSASRIVAGKLLSCFLVGGITTASTLPLVTVVVFFGGVAPETILVSYLALLACAFMATLLGVWASSMTATTTRAIILVYMALGPYLLLVGSCVWLPLDLLGLVQIGLLPLSLAAALAPGNVALLVTVAVLLLSFVGRLVFLLAVNGVASPSANRSTALRVLFVAVVGALLLSVATALELNQASLVGTGAKGVVSLVLRHRLALTAGYVLSGLLLLGTVVFCAEEIMPSKRSTAGQSSGVFRSLLIPGSRSGVRLMLCVLVVSLPLMAVILWRGFDLTAEPPVGWRPGGYALRWWVAWTMAFLLLIGQVSCWASRRMAPAYTRYWVCLMVVALVGWPLFPYLVLSRGKPSSVHHGYYLSAPLVLRSIWMPPTETFRSLQLGGHSSDEIRARLVLLQEESGPSAGQAGEGASGAAGQQGDTLRRPVAQERLGLVSGGVSVHVASTLVFAILGTVIGLFNMLRGDRPRGQ